MKKPMALYKDAMSAESLWQFWSETSQRSTQLNGVKKDILFLESLGVNKYFDQQERYFIWYKTMILIGLFVKEHPNWKNMSVEEKSYSVEEQNRRTAALRKKVKLLSDQYKDIPRGLLCLMHEYKREDYVQQCERRICEVQQQVQTLSQWAVSPSEQESLTLALSVVKLFVTDALSAQHVKVLNTHLDLPDGRLHATLALTGSIDLVTARIVSEGFKQLHQCSAEQVMQVMSTLIVSITGTGSSELAKQEKALDRVTKSVANLQKQFKNDSTLLCVLQVCVQSRNEKSVFWSMLEPICEHEQWEQLQPWQMQRVSAKDYAQLSRQCESYKKYSEILVQEWKSVLQRKGLWQVGVQTAPSYSNVWLVNAYASAIGNSVFFEQWLSQQMPKGSYDGWVRQCVGMRKWDGQSIFIDCMLAVLVDAQSAVGVLFKPMKSYQTIKYVQEQAQQYTMIKAQQNIFDRYASTWLRRQIDQWCAFAMPWSLKENLEILCTPWEYEAGNWLVGAPNGCALPLSHQMEQLVETPKGKQWLEYLQWLVQVREKVDSKQCNAGVLYYGMEAPNTDRKPMVVPFNAHKVGQYEARHVLAYIGSDPKVFEAFKTACAHHQDDYVDLIDRIMLRMGLSCYWYNCSSSKDSLDQRLQKVRSIVYTERGSESEQVMERIKKTQALFDQYCLDQVLQRELPNVENRSVRRSL